MIPPDQVAAVLLAGGQSTRMGRDKAFLPFGPQDRPLWEIQIEKLAALDPATLVISARDDQSFPNRPAVPDSHPGLGPLSALAAVFTATNQPCLLPLAVDMPDITTGFLQRILAAADPERGLVFKHGDLYEPFPALYPRTLSPLVDERLATGDRSMQSFIRAATDKKLLQPAPLPVSDSALFKNLNTPEDL